MGVGSDEWHNLKVEGTKTALKGGRISLNEGDRVRIVSSGGGGYGNPFERDHEMVLEDAINETISLEAAKRDYGVILKGTDPDYTINWETTKKYRKENDYHDDREHPIEGGVVTVCDDSFRLRRRIDKERVIGKLEKQQHGDILADRIMMAKESLNLDECKQGCVKQADPRQCPFYNKEAYLFWTREAIIRWIGCHCPQRDRLTGILQ